MGLNRNILIFSVLFLFLFSFITASSTNDGEIGVNLGQEGSITDGSVGVNFVNPPKPVNYSQVNVNNSQYLQGYTPTTLKTWIQNAFDSVYCLLTGCTMQGNINMNENNITNINKLTTNEISPTGTTLYINGDFEQTGDAVVDGAYEITGDAYLDSNTYVEDNLDVSGNLSITGYSYVGGLYTCNNGTATIMTRNKTLANSEGCSI